MPDDNWAMSTIHGRCGQSTANIRWAIYTCHDGWWRSTTNIRLLILLDFCPWHLPKAHSLWMIEPVVAWCLCRQLMRTRHSSCMYALADFSFCCSKSLSRCLLYKDYTAFLRPTSTYYFVQSRGDAGRPGLTLVNHCVQTKGDAGRLCLSLSYHCV